MCNEELKQKVEQLGDELEAAYAQIASNTENINELEERVSELEEENLERE